MGYRDDYFAEIGPYSFSESCAPAAGEEEMIVKDDVRNSTCQNGIMTLSGVA
jgi:hypothetical protein